MQLGCLDFFEKKNRWPFKNHRVFGITTRCWKINLPFTPQNPQPRAVRNQCLVSSGTTWLGWAGQNDGTPNKHHQKLNPNMCVFSSILCACIYESMSFCIDSCSIDLHVFFFCFVCLFMLCLYHIYCFVCCLFMFCSYI